MKYEDKLPENIGLGVIVWLLSSTTIFITIVWLLWQIPYPEKLTHINDHIKYWTAFKVNQLAPPLFQETADFYKQYLDNLGASSRQILWRLNIASIVAIMFGGFVGYLAGKPQPAIRHVSGRRLRTGADAVRRISWLSKNECKDSREGLAMHPTFKWLLSIARETRHFLLLGGSGSGKTQILVALIRAAIARNDRMMIYDIKGDFTQWLPKHILLAPWDQRSFAWDVAMDCRNSQDAKQLAARFIAEGNDPMWHQAARMIFTALIIKLQVEKRLLWSWADLYDLVCADDMTLLSIVKQYKPEAVNLLSFPGKTTQSILINFSANMGLVSDLAKAWGDTPVDKRFSFLSWLTSPKTSQRIIVLQGSGRYDELAKAYIQGVIAMVSGFINSSEFPDGKRRIWMFLDELPQLGRISMEFIATCRSKGLRIVASAQDLQQIKEIYGTHLTSTWMSMVGTIIITKTNAGDTANYIVNDVIGTRTVDRVVMHKNERQAPLREKVLVMEPSELQSELGRNGSYISAVLLGYDDAFLLRWPIEEIKKSNYAMVPAKWLANPVPKKSQVQKIAMPIDSASVIPTKPRPRLVLRSQAQTELMAMAESGTNMSNAAEPADAMSASSIGRLR